MHSPQAQPTVQEAWHSYWNHYTLDNLERIISYKREIYRLYDQLLGEVEGKSCLEIGGGTGRISLHLARRDARTTILDSSPKAAEIQADYFRFFNLEHCSIVGDFVSYESSETYDIVHSEGFLEHFDPAQRKALIRKMYDLLKPGGLLLIMLPNKHNPFYRIGKWVFEHTGQWNFGTEHLVDLTEIEEAFRALGLTHMKTGGSFLLSSWNWLIPVMGFNFRVKFFFLGILRRLGVSDTSTSRLYSRYARQVAIIARKP